MTSQTKTNRRPSILISITSTNNGYQYNRYVGNQDGTRICTHKGSTEEPLGVAMVKQLLMRPASCF